MISAQNNVLTSKISIWMYM